MQKVPEQGKNLGVGRMELLQSAITHKQSLSLRCVCWLWCYSKNLQLKRHHSCCALQSVHLLFKITPGLNGAPSNEVRSSLCNEQVHVPSISSCPFLSSLLFHRLVEDEDDTGVSAFDTSRLELWLPDFLLDGSIVFICH